MEPVTLDKDSLKVEATSNLDSNHIETNSMKHGEKKEKYHILYFK